MDLVVVVSAVWAGTGEWELAAVGTVVGALVAAYLSEVEDEERAELAQVVFVVLVVLMGVLWAGK